MLAQSFKSAADLGLNEKQKDALVKTLVLLETDKLEHTQVHQTIEPNRWVAPAEREFSYQFNMESWSLQHNCGTVCCIGGTAELVGHLKDSDRFDEDSNPRLYELFYPRGTGVSYKEITPAQAALALRSYLTTGNAHWFNSTSTSRA